ncbi:deoxyribonuclease [Nanobdella aerobiophila]|uniref:Deoxyribonuclease n=1 Tax=Nanobdella aerobiophila TaxID=2586965 RepID=A0A915WT17_9ARCH|nr:TRAM domain-containing protein [Nanobdella aerobiophila]BBL45762.1 deoxyribonuclease [Nanobdella aerobiophila]
MVVRGIKVGEIYEVEIKSLTQRGDGFARVKGIACFVKNVTVGWKGNVKVVKVGPSYIVAEPSGEASSSQEASSQSSEESFDDSMEEGM